MDLKAILKRGEAALFDRLPAPVARTLWLFQQTVKGFLAHEGPAWSATIAYYTFFSVFPLTLFLIVLASYFLEPQVTRQEIYTYLGNYVPQAADTMQANVEQILQARGAIGFVAIMAFLWAASGMFSAISHAIQRAWGLARPRPFWEEKLLALGMVLVVSLLFLVSILASTVLSLMRQWPDLDAVVPSFNHAFWSVLSVALPVSGMFVLLALIYRLLPTTSVPGRAVLAGAALATVAWAVAKDALAFYLAHFARYDLVYGQVEAFIILLLYFYFVGMVVLLGAEFTAACARLVQGDSAGSQPGR